MSITMTNESLVGYRISPQQRRLWKLAADQAASPYRLRARIKLGEGVERTALEAALLAAVARHEILRTGFRLLSGMSEPVQVIAEETPRGPLPGVSEGFDLSTPPLLAARLGEEGSRVVELELEVSALCLDAVGLGALIGELSTALSAAGGEPSEVLQYADVSEVLNDLLEDEEMQQGRERWQKVDLGPWSEPALSFEKATGAFLPERVSRQLSDDLAASARSLGEELGAADGAVWLATWALLLGRLAGRREMLVGVAFDGRSYEEFEGALGPFFRLLPGVFRVAPGTSFVRLVEQVSSWCGEAAMWQDFHAFAPGAAAPYGFELRELPGLGSLGSSWRVEELGGVWERCSLHLEVLRRQGETGSWLELVYDASRVAEADAVALLERYAVLLDGALSNPRKMVADLAWLTAVERAQILGEWAATEHSYAVSERWLPALVARTASAGPDLVAASYLDSFLSYGELQRRSASLARRLRASGVGRGDRVGVYLERSLEMPWGLLGILRSGAAYVPLDGEYPADRLAYLVSDSGVTAVVFRAGSEPGAWAGAARSIEISAPLEEAAGGLDTNPVVGHGEDLAYVIYTSGSTGHPKGVAVPHRAIANRLLWQAASQDFAAGCRVLQKTPLSFDASVWEIFVPLLSGGEVTVARPGGHQDPEYLVRTVLRQRVQVIQLVPSLLRWFLAEDGLGDGGSLARVYCGGEALVGELRRRFLERLPGVELHNLYGPTETSIDATWERCTADPIERISIGRALFNTRVYVVGDGLHPVPPGVLGEVSVSGAGLAWGYLGRPGLTAERFVPDALSGGSGERLYRTGDLGRLGRDGVIEYVGRRDRQVKVRGVRVELGEVESALMSHDGVRESAVVVQEDPTGDHRLVAYVASKSTPTELREWLLEHLPTALLPSQVVVLERLPRLPSGKLDTGSLPSPEEAAADSRPHAAPRTVSEHLLAEAFSAVLGVDPVDVEGDFFELGGDSIRSIQVLAEARERGLDFSVQDLFRARTVRALAVELDPPLSEPLPLEEVLPFSLISEEDRHRVPEGVEDAYPLSYLQAGMMYHSELDPDAPVYHDLVSMHLRMPLDLDLLHRSIRSVLERHAVLRTSFDAAAYSQPLQLVHDDLEPELAVVDLSHLDAEEQAQKIAQWGAAATRRPFAWDRPPLMRFHVFLRGEEEFSLVVGKHHILTDGWSFATLMTELFRTYLAYAAGEYSESPPPEIDYRHFIALEQAALASKESRDYWQEKLGEAPLFRLPRWPGVGQPGSLFQHDIALDKPVYEGLMRIAREASVPIKDVLLAAHLRVMSRLGGSDVVTGLVSTGRPERLGGERIIGLFLNALPFRQRLTGGRWLDLVRETFANEREMLAHRRYPMAEIQQHQGVDSLLETDFNFLHYHVFEEVERLGGLEVVDMEYFEHTNFALSATFALILKGKAINLSLAGDPQILSPEQFERIAKYYHRALRSMAQDPSSRYELEDLLGEEERREVLERWNETSVEYPGQARTLHGLVWQQAARTPDRVALCSVVSSALSSVGVAVSYGELRSRAQMLAGRLAASGVVRGSRVGVYAERSVEMVMALLGVLESGAAYVPLDPESPRERLEWMVRDAGLEVLLVGPGLGGSAPSADLTRLELVDLQGARWGLASPGPRSAAGPGDLAYGIYTSGSTGRPKGVLIPHRAITNRLLWMQSTRPLGADDRVLQRTPLSFDASVWELFVPLLAGSGVVLAEAGRHGDASYLVGLAARERVTSLQLVPSLLGLAFDEGLGNVGSLARVYCGGEALPGELRRRFYEVSFAELHNLYGPTEASIDAAAELCERGEEPSRVTLGWPIANTQVYVLDDVLLPLPLGAAGELFLGGEGLAWGYLGRAGLTAERFVPHPYSSTAGGRLYRTGDLGRQRPDGRLEYLGRQDRQVKVSGVRVEPGEVESSLSGHPGVSESAVVMQREGEGWHLVAFVVARGQRPPLGSELRAYLLERLPRSMVPSRCVLLEELPRLPNGKLDREQLAALRATVSSGEGYVAPRTPVEELVAEIWAEVLGRERVGLEDDFFALGGHSLLATQVISRLRRSFRVDIALRVIFETSTLSGLAGRVEGLLSDAPAPEAPPLERIPRDRPLPLSFAQQRLWFLEQFDAQNPAYNVPMMVRCIGELDVRALENGLREVLRRQEVLRTRFPAPDGKPVQVIEALGAWYLAVIDLGVLPAAKRELEAHRIGSLEARRRFDLESGPVFRVRLVRLAAEDHAVLMTMHHIVSDGWSGEVLLRDLAELYRASLAGRGPELPGLQVQYADFAVWQRRWLTDEKLGAQLAYWRECLAGAPELLELPTDRPRGGALNHRGKVRGFDLPVGLSTGLRKLARQESTTLYMTLLAGFAALLARSSGQSDLSIGTPISGRSRPELEDLVGCFLNTLVMRIQLVRRDTFRQVLARVREVTLGAYAHQDLPFERLVEDLQPGRTPSRTPLFQVAFVFQNTHRSTTIDLPTLRFTPFEVESGTAKFDLNLALADDGEQLVGSLEYNADLFDSTTIQAFVGRYHRLLDALVEFPESRVGAVSLLAVSERQQLLQEWNDPSQIEAAAGSLHRAFELQAERRPDRVAACSGDRWLSYGMLDRLANGLGHHLRGLGVGAEVPVCLAFEPCLEMLIAILGVAKAGGAYVPLDPAYPASRLELMLADALAASPAPVLVSDGSTRLTVPTRTQVVELTVGGAITVTEGAAESRGTSPSAQVQPGNLAYIIYTSGSTGRPKGVQVEHRNALRLFAAAQEEFHFDTDSVWTFFHSYAFDFSVWEIWGAWLGGGRLVVVPKEVSRAADAFWEVVVRQRVSVLNQTPSAFQQLMQAEELLGEEAGTPAALRHVIFGGEALDLASLEPWFDRHGDQRPRLVNMYGITETTVHTTLRPLSRTDLRSGHRSPVGGPLADLRLQLLDPDLRLVPIGVPGELFVGGAGVARGYFGRPGLTAERFVPDPFAQTSGERLYRSGDLARRRGGGEIDFLGRADHQVKIRGFRIELGEIEATLAGHPAVRKAVVMSQEDAMGTSRLAAWVVLGDEISTPRELLDHLREELPEYMVPAAMVVLEEMPLTVQGKVDRRRLPGPEVDLGARELVAPRNPVEEAVMAIWAEVLGLEELGVQHSFFDLGGHSLSAMQVIYRLRDTFQVHLPVGELFSAPTVERLAELLVAHDPRPGRVKKIAAAWKKVREMSPEKVRESLLARKKKQPPMAGA